MMDRKVEKRIKIVTAIVCAAAIFFSAHTVFADQSKRWGPIVCNPCDLQMPYPSPYDETKLRAFVKDPYPGEFILFPDSVSVGDVITICTATDCVDYKLNNSRNFEGGNPRKIGNVGGGGTGDGKGSGGSTGGGGGTNVGSSGGGCIGHCTGTVTIKVPPFKKNPS